MALDMCDVCVFSHNLAALNFKWQVWLVTIINSITAAILNFIYAYP